MIVNSLCFRKSLKNKAKSSLTSLILMKNKTNKNVIKYCFSDGYKA